MNWICAASNRSGISRTPRHNLCYSAAARMKLLLIAGFALFSVLALTAQQPAAPPANPMTSAPIQQISETVFQVGQVRLDKDRKSISIPSSINMTNGVIEYLLVGAAGKRHESILITEAQPHHIHVAMLLLGATNRTAATESGQPLFGQPIAIQLSWTANERTQTARAEEWIRKDENGKSVPMEAGAWIYNGSRIIDGTFIAQRDESIVAIIHDPDALANNPRKGRENDEIWFVNEQKVPPMGTRVQVFFQLIEAEKPKPDPK